MENLRKTKKGMMALIAMGIIVVVCVAVVLMISKSEKGFRTVSVSEIVGTATVKHGDKEYAAYVDMKLQEGCDLTTADKSYVRMVLDEKKYIRVEENSRVVFETLGTEGSKKTCLVLEYGIVTNEITTELGEGEEYIIDTPNTMLAVKGTFFRVIVRTNENGEMLTDIYTYGGMVQCKRMLFNGEIVEEDVQIDAGYKTTVSTGEDGTDYIVEQPKEGKENVEPISLEDIPDADLVDMYVASLNGHEMFLGLEEIRELIEERGIEVENYTSNRDGTVVTLPESGEDDESRNDQTDTDETENENGETEGEAQFPNIEFTVLELNYGTLYLLHDTKVYDSPHGWGESIGVINRGEAIEATGKCPKTGWFRFEYNGQVGYVDGSALASSAPEGSTPIPGDGEVIVPDLSGMTKEEAAAVLEEMGLLLSDIVYGRYCYAYPEGEIFLQEPACGNVVAKGTEIIISYACEPAVTPKLSESWSAVSIVRRQIIERGENASLREFSSITCVYKVVEEFEYSDGAILQVTYYMEDDQMEDVSAVRIIKSGDHTVKPKEILPSGAYYFLGVTKDDPVYSLGYFEDSYGEYEYLVLVTGKGVSIPIHRESRSYLASVGNPIFDVPVDKYADPLYWAGDRAQDAKISETGDDLQLDVTFSDQSSYRIFYRIAGNVKKVKKVTFYDSAGQEKNTVYYREVWAPYMCLLYSYVGDNQVRLVNYDGTPVEKYKHLIFDDDAFLSSYGGGADMDMSERCTLEMNGCSFDIKSWKFTALTIDGETIILSMRDFPVED